MPTDTFASLMTTAGGTDRARRRLSRGEVLDATVMQISSEWVFVDVGTPSDGRIPRGEMADKDDKVRVAVGDRLRVSVVEPRFEGSILKALGQSAPPGEAPQPNEVVSGKVTRIEKFGLFVSTPKGDGLVPLRELPIPTGSDHRKLFPVGKELTLVVLDANAEGKLRFSATRVARVEEEQNFRDFASGAQPAPEAAAAVPNTPSKGKAPPPVKPGFGSLGDLMRAKLGGAVAAALPTPTPNASPTSKTPAKPAPGPVAPPRTDVQKRRR